MSIPHFSKNGFLPKGIHKISGEEFIDHFCNSEYRSGYKKAITDIFDYAVQRNAEYLFVGGSFIANVDEPNDIDCLIVFRENSHIPPRSERLIIEGVSIDVMFASLDNKVVIDSYIHLFSHSRYNHEVGMIQLDLYKKNQEWEIQHPGYEDYEIIKQAYINRHIIDLNKPKGVLVTIHGLLSTAEWNKEIAPLASSQGWIFAPFIYNENTPDLLINKNKRDVIINEFREWIFDLSKRFEGGISVIAHSFGTYLLASYLEGFEEPPVTFNTIILSGAILNSNFDWEKHKGVSVGKVLNEIAPNDQWVKFMPEKFLKKLLCIDPLMGKAGIDGFNQECNIVKQTTNRIFTHNNVIKRDVIQNKWIPFLDANRNSFREEFMKKIKNEL